MALTDQQKKELDIASARQASGTASETDIQNINYAKQNLGYTYTSPTATPTSPQTAPTATQTQQTTQTPPPAQTDQQKGLQAAQDRIKAGTANDTDRANVNYAIQTGLIKPVVVNPTNNFEPQLPGGAVDNQLNADEISSNLTSPSTVIADRTAEDQAFKQAIADTTNSYLSGLDQQIAQLNNQYLSIIQKQEQAKQAEVDRLTAGYESAGNISLYDTQKDLLERFQVEANIELYKDLQTKAVDAAKMVQDGIDGLDTATYLTSVVSGRQNQLYKQGLNVITSLNATAEIVKGNIDIASGYVDSLISTLEKDRTTKLSVLGGLIDLHNADLINLKQDEKDIVEKQIDLLEKEATQIQKNKDDVLSYYKENPILANKAGVYFTDKPQEALQKMANYVIDHPEYNPSNSTEIVDGNLVLLNPYTGIVKNYGKADTLTDSDLFGFAQELFTSGNYSSFGDAYGAVDNIVNGGQGTVIIPGNTLAYRNNNPGNLRYVGQSGAVKGENGFAKFVSPEAGYQALISQIQLDASRGLTLGSFINKYAPPNENDTALYITQVEQMTGYSRDEKLSEMDVNIVAQAMAMKESGTKIISETPQKTEKFTPEWYATTEGQKALNNEQQYFSSFKGEKIVQNFNEVQNKSASVNSIIDNGVGGPGDLALVFEFMKALDPTSVVREAEYDSASKSGNIFLGSMAKFNGYLKAEGGILPDSVKESFRQIVAQKLNIAQQQYQNLRNEYRSIAESQGLNPDNVAPNLDIDFTTNQSYLVPTSNGQIDLSKFEQ